MAVIGNAPFQGLVSGGEILDASIEGVDLSTSAIAARLGYTPVDPGAAVFSANPTISSGVANGVAYLNGSKVVTSGSALTFDGSTLSINNGVTSASISLIGTYAGSGTVAFLNFQRVGGAVAGTLGYDDSINSIRFGTTTNHSTVFLQNNAEAMRLASTGLGIGLGGSNPSAKLHVKGTEYAQIIETASTTDNDTIRLALIAPGAQSQVELEWWNDSTKTGGGYGLIQTGKSANSPDFNFMVGKLGIGTISPANKLDVYQSNAGLGAAKILHVNGNYINVQPSYNYYAAYNHIFQSLNGTTEYGRFLNDGSLLIGTTANYTTAKLYVENKISVNYSGEISMRYNNSDPAENTGYWKGITGQSPGAGGSARGLHLFNYDKDSDEGINFWTGRPGTATQLMKLTSAGNLGIGQTSPQEKLDVNGNIYIHTATGNPYLKIKTDGGGNNPTIRLQADGNYWDVQGTFSNTHDDLQFLYNGVNKFAFGNNSIGGLSISNGNNQYGRLTVDTDGHQHVVRGGGLNGGDYYYRYLKLFKLRVSTNSGSSTEVKGRLHLSRVNEIGISTMVDFYASQGYSTQIRTWYKRIAGPEGGTNFRFVTMPISGDTYLCLEFVSAPGWNSWQFEGSVIDFDGARGSFAVTALENLTTLEVGPWGSIGADPSTPLLQDTTYGPHVVGIFNYDYNPAGTNVTVATTHIFGAPQTSGNYGEAARITSNGNVLIGTTSANGGSLQIKRNSGLTHTTSAIQIDSYDADYYTTLHIGSIDTYDIGYIQTAAKNQSFSTKSLSLQPNGGNVGIGTSLNSNNTSKLTVWGDTQLYAGTSGQSPSLVFGAETGAPKKAIFLSGFWLTIQGHNNEGIRMQTVDASGNATTRMTVAGSGAVTIPGSLSKGSGSFRIPHPLPSKFESHELVHSFIEGPQADLIYRGKVALASGQAIVNIDTATGMTSGTFEALCRDIQCFTTNETGWTAIKGKVVGNILTIEAQDPACTDEVSWMVIGERKDQHMMDTDWTDENGKVIVEPLKPVAETQGGNQ